MGCWLWVLLLLPLLGADDFARTAAATDGAAYSHPMPLTVLPAAEATRRGAVCLDGSPPGLYFRAATGARSNSKSWVIFMKGGAWCSSVADCVGRSRTNLGSSTKFPPSYSVGGPLDPSPSKNPTFYGFNHVVLFYCDGASFAGNVEAPLRWVDPKNSSSITTLYFRGQRVLEYAIDWLIENRGLGSATDVLFGGGSAGGLATFLRADAVHQQLLQRQTPIKRFRGLPVSGWFLDHATVSGTHSFAQSMHDTFVQHNCTGGVPAACLGALPMHEHWRCFMANYSFPAIHTPLFLLQSDLDLYQLFAILRMGGWQAGCLNTDAQFNGSSTQPACTPAQVLQLQHYSNDFMHDLGRSLRASSAAGNGGFIHSCLGHQDAIGMTGGDWQRIAINGTTMQEAVSDWWMGNGNNWHFPCQVTTSPPHQCNPSCAPALHKL
jgi:hypothetical protein